MNEKLAQLMALVETQSKAVKAMIEEHGGVAKLTETAKAWVADGKKLVLSQEQVKKLMGDERIQRVAEKLKTTPDQLATMLGEALPPLLQKIETVRTKLDEASAAAPAGSFVGGILKKVSSFLGTKSDTNSTGPTDGPAPKA